MNRPRQKKIDAILEMLLQHPEKSNAAIARLAGASRAHVSETRQRLPELLKARGNRSTARKSAHRPRSPEAQRCFDAHKANPGLLTLPRASVMDAFGVSMSALKRIRSAIRRDLGGGEALRKHLREQADALAAAHRTVERLRKESSRVELQRTRLVATWLLAQLEEDERAELDDLPPEMRDAVRAIREGLADGERYWEEEADLMFGTDATLFDEDLAGAKTDFVEKNVRADPFPLDLLKRRRAA